MVVVLHDPPWTKTTREGASRAAAHATPMLEVAAVMAKLRIKVGTLRERGPGAPVKAKQIYEIETYAYMGQ